MQETYEWRGSKARVGGRESRFQKRTASPDAENMILAALPPKELAYVRQFLQVVPLKAGEIIVEPNEPIRSVYFPTSGMVSFVAVMRDGATAEVGIAGREGFVGTSAVRGARNAPFRAMVQCTGTAFRIEAGLLRRILPRTPQLKQMLDRYADQQAIQVAQIAACNCLHEVPERLARWLAMTYHQTGSDLLPVTQELLGQMLGCRRSSVTSAIGRLSRAGVIRPGHGQLRILDRRRLERRACECYSLIRRLFDLTEAT